MPRCSAFNPTRFSSRKTEAEIIYRDLVRAYGSGANYSDDFDSLASARLYAMAMSLGHVLRTLNRAGQQYRPDRALELLPALEREYGVTPDANATIALRRILLAVAMRIARGASRENVETVMTQLLGSDLVGYRTVDQADAVVLTATPETEGIYPPLGSSKSVYRLTGEVVSLGVPVTVAYEFIAGAVPVIGAAPVPVWISDGHRSERVDVTDAGSGMLSATFDKPHVAGVVFGTGRQPYLWSSKRHHLFLLSDSAVRDERLRRRAQKQIRTLLRGVSTWSLASGTGPFKVESGLIGITPIGDLS